ncbi:MAG: hypothetical protein FD167_3615 [bacterium]|nr:MAG: hypothetical protein FD167_3615 [bacterium]
MTVKQYQRKFIIYSLFVLVLSQVITKIINIPEKAQAQTKSTAKVNYLAMREKHVNLLRGLPHNLSYDPRRKAISEMQQQEQEIFSRRIKDGVSPLISATTWTSIGPSPIPNGIVTNVFGTNIPVSGRISAIAVHPTNPDIVYVGAAQGGVFR